MNDNVNIEINSIRDFRAQLETSFNHLLRAVDVMQEKSIANDDMINSKTGNLYKKVMLEKLENEKKSLLSDSETLLSTVDKVSVLLASAALA